MDRTRANPLLVVHFRVGFGLASGQMLANRVPHLVKACRICGGRGGTMQLACYALKAAEAQCQIANSGRLSVAATKVVNLKMKRACA